MTPTTELDMLTATAAIAVAERVRTADAAREALLAASEAATVASEAQDAAFTAARTLAAERAAARVEAVLATQDQRAAAEEALEEARIAETAALAAIRHLLDLTSPTSEQVTELLLRGLTLASATEMSMGLQPLHPLVDSPE